MQLEKNRRTLKRRMIIKTVRNGRKRYKRRGTRRGGGRKETDNGE
jgi:hypothetical protein